MKSTVYLIPGLLDDTSVNTIPHYILECIKQCQVIFAENERTARRFFKTLSKDIVIDDFEWYTIHNIEQEQVSVFRKKLEEGKNIGIVSEAGCPGVADPGQMLVNEAHHMNAIVKPLVGPSSILLALMASGLNGQQFQFTGYLPIEAGERVKTIKDLETESHQKNCTQIFIETPYRNNALIESLLKTCKPNTRICIGAGLTSSSEFISTKTVSEWRKEKIDLHKKPTIFLLKAE